MKYTVIADSSCDLKAIDLQSTHFDFVTAPISFSIGEKEYSDTEDINTKEVIAALKLHKGAPKTGAASPEYFSELMRNGKEYVICVTLSSKLSATYNNAVLAANTVLEEQPNKKIFVLDSLSASAAVINILFKLKEFIESGNFTFEEIIEKITAVRGKAKIRFLLQDLSNLIKSGRMNKILGLIVNVLTIKPVLGDNGNGEIKSYGKALGFKKGIQALAEFPGEKVKQDGCDMPIVITHCHNEEGASLLKSLLETKFGLKNIKTFLMRGIASFYANDKGLAMAY